MAVEEGPMAVFNTKLRECRFMIQRSKSRGEYVFYPRTVMPGSGETDLEWVDASGRAQVYASTTIYPRKQPAYNVSIIQLEEGPRLMSQVVGIDPEQVSIGMAVYAQVDVTKDEQGNAVSGVLRFSAAPAANEEGQS